MSEIYASCRDLCQVRGPSVKEVKRGSDIESTAYPTLVCSRPAWRKVERRGKS